MINLARSPLCGESITFQDNDSFKGFWVLPLTFDVEAAPKILIVLTETNTIYTVRVEIPGARKEDIRVQVEGRKVSISADLKQEKEEKKDDKVICWCYQGSSCRTFTLDCEVDEEQALASYADGVLELKLPKKILSAGRQLQIA